MYIAVCDDNTLFLRDIEAQLREIPLVTEVASFSNYNAFLFSVEYGASYDVVIMDIDLGAKSTGMDIAEELYSLSPRTKIIFVTSFNDLFSQQIFLHQVNLSGFLTKPVDFNILDENIKKAFHNISSEEGPMLVIKQRGAPISIPTNTIIHIESHAHIAEIHTATDTILTYEQLDKIFKRLPNSFYNCHKSFIINMQQVRRFQPKSVLLKNGREIPVSRSKYSETKEAYFRFVGQTF